MKLFKSMMIFFILAIITGVTAFSLQSTTAYRTSTLMVLIAVISLIFSFIFALMTTMKYRDIHRGVTIFVLVCTSIGILFVLIIVIFILFFLNA